MADTTGKKRLKAGLEFGNENFSLGINYNLLVGEHATNHGVFGTLRVNF